LEPGKVTASGGVERAFKRVLSGVNNKSTLGMVNPLRSAQNANRSVNHDGSNLSSFAVSSLFHAIHRGVQQ
jgi:hypothetical protein